MSQTEFVDDRWLTYSQWREQMEKVYPKIVDVVENCLSVLVQLWFADIDLPFALVLVGSPAGYKTAAIKIVEEALILLHEEMPNLPELHYKSDSFTPKSFVSHKSDAKETTLRKVDLLPKIKDKLLLTPEMAPNFTSSEEDLKKQMGVLTRVLDGEGYTTDSGAHGQRGYKEAHKFMWIAGTTPISYKVWQIMGNLGTKTYFMLMPDLRKKKKDMVAMLRDRRGERAHLRKIKKCGELTYKLLPRLLRLGEPIDWDTSKDPEDIMLYICGLAQLLACLRGAVNVSMMPVLTSGGVREAGYTMPIIENPDRAAVMLYNFARGHAFVCGRENLTMDDMKPVIEIAFSSAPRDRILCFRALVINGGSMTTARARKLMGCAKNTALRAMEALSVLDLVDKSETSVRGGYTFKITLKEKFNWVTNPKFTKLWGVEIAERAQEEKVTEIKSDNKLDLIFDSESVHSQRGGQRGK